MIIYLGGTTSNEKTAQIVAKRHAYVLESYVYANDITERYMSEYGGFMADSGAFTYMNGKDASKIDWERYAKGYAAFINRNHIKYYLELDIDNVVGYSEVLKLRKKLEEYTGVTPIPVWHMSRGKDVFIQSTKDYPYVAIGSMVVSEKGYESKAKLFLQSLPWFIKVAHENGAKIHGLGYAKMDGLKKCHFDSIDCTTWQTGGTRFGYAHVFNGERIKKIRRPEGTKMTADSALFNLNSWISFQKYALYNL